LFGLSAVTTEVIQGRRNLVPFILVCGGCTGQRRDKRWEELSERPINILLVTRRLPVAGGTMLFPRAEWISLSLAKAQPLVAAIAEDAMGL
jgi:hypothetical protein